jgi:hypothetical protein
MKCWKDDIHTQFTDELLGMIFIHSSQMKCWKDDIHTQFTDEMLEG